MASLQAITDAMGKWLLANDWQVNDGEWKFDYSVSTTGDHTGMPFPPCEVEYLRTDFELTPFPPEYAELIFDETYNNRSSSVQEFTISQSKTTTTEFMWNLTEALDIGVTVTGKAGVPFVAEGSVEVNSSISFSSTQQTTNSVATTWTEEETFSVAPMCSFNAKGYVYHQKATEIKFTNYTKIKGWGICVFTKPGGLYYISFPIEYFVIFAREQNIADTSGFEPTEGYLYAMSKGIFTGTQGLYLSTEVSEAPLDSASRNAVCSPRGHRTLA